MEYYVIRTKYDHWNRTINKLSNIKCVDNINDIPFEKSNKSNDKISDKIKIIPLTIDDMISYNNDKRLLFRSTIETINTLNDKSYFSCFMMKYFTKNYPKVYYLDSKYIKYVCNDKNHFHKKKMIIRPNLYYGGIGAKIIYDFNCNLRNVVITQYLDHNEYYVGHFFVMNGEIKKQVYFKAQTGGEPDFILRCPITRNKIECIERIERIECVEHRECVDDIKNNHLYGRDVNVFSEIFQKLNYSGFACADFIIVDKTIIVFEINPRPGGSLFDREDICRDFFDLITR
jgi:hypothetical protein